MRQSTVTTLVLILWSMSAAFAATQEPTPPGSFLKYRARTVAELVQQVSRDKAVQSRYARHFRMISTEILSTLRGLKLVTLRSATRTRSWYVDRNGKVNLKTKLLPKGAQVFATAEGTPLLLWSCGNPVRAQVPRRVARATRGSSAASDKPPVSNAPSTDAPVETKVLAEQPEMIGQPPAAAPTMMAAADAPLAALPESPVIQPPTAAPTPVAPAAPLVVAAPPAAGGGGISGLAVAGGLAGILGGLAAVELGKSDPGNPPNLPPPPVPEPMGIIAMGAGLSVLVMSRIRRSGARRGSGK